MQPSAALLAGVAARRTTTYRSSGRRRRALPGETQKRVIADADRERPVHDHRLAAVPRPITPAHAGYGDLAGPSRPATCRVRMVDLQRGLLSPDHWCIPGYGPLVL